MSLRDQLTGIRIWFGKQGISVFGQLQGHEYLMDRAPVTTDDVAKLTAKLHELRLVHSCCTCLRFNAQKEECTLAQQRPPAHVIAYGCPAWQDMEGTQFTPANPAPLTRS